jgi:dihydrofolate reductase
VTQSKFAGKVVLDMSISLDGFTAGPDISFESRLGINGERLHTWMFGEKSEADAEVDIFKTSGAVITGRRTFDMGEEPWGDNGTFGMPCFVLTHRPKELLIKGPTTFTFVTDGLESALAQAKIAAGEKDVWIMGAADIAHQYLRAGLVDEIIVHIVPVLLGAGSRLFDEIGSQPIELEQVRVIPSPQVTHIYYRVLKA